MKDNKIILLFLISTLAQFPLATMRFILPIYAKNVGASIFTLGIMGSAYGLVYIVLASYFGRISDRVGQKSLMVSGLLLYAAVISIYFFIKIPDYFILGRAMEAIAMAMVWPSMEAYAHGINARNRETSLLVYTFSWSIAATVAPYFAAFMIQDLYYLPLAIAMILSVFGALTTLKIPARIQSTEFIDTLKYNTFFDLALPIFIYGFVSAIVSSFYPVFGKVIMLGISNTGLIMSISSAFLILAFFISWALTKKMNIRILSLTGLILQVFILFLYLYHSFWVQLLIMAMIGFGQGFIYFNVLLSVYRSFNARVASKTGIFESSIGAGFVAGPIIAGIPTALGYAFPWIVAAAGAFIIAVIYLFAFLKVVNKNNK
ncbi:MAG: MFS transporter [Thermoplasmata archaeon]